MFDVNALDLPVETGVEPVRPVPDGDGQLLRVGVHTDHDLLIVPYGSKDSAKSPHEIILGL